MNDLNEVHAVSHRSFIQAERYALPTQSHAVKADRGLELPMQIADASLLQSKMSLGSCCNLTLVQNGLNFVA